MSGSAAPVGSVYDAQQTWVQIEKGQCPGNCPEERKCLGCKLSGGCMLFLESEDWNVKFCFVCFCTTFMSSVYRLHSFSCDRTKHVIADYVDQSDNDSCGGDDDIDNKDGVDDGDCGDPDPVTLKIYHC